MRPIIVSLALIFGLLLGSTATAQEIRTPRQAQSLYLPIYSHMTYGNIGRNGKASQVLLSTLVSIRNTDSRHSLRITTARYYDTHGRMVGDRAPKPVIIPPFGTHELFIDLNDASGGSGANFLIRWESDQPISPPLVEGLHANLDGGKAVVFLTQAIPITE